MGLSGVGGGGGGGGAAARAGARAGGGTADGSGSGSGSGKVSLKDFLELTSDEARRRILENMEKTLGGKDPGGHIPKNASHARLNPDRSQNTVDSVSAQMARGNPVA